MFPGWVPDAEIPANVSGWLVRMSIRVTELPCTWIVGPTKVDYQPRQVIYLGTCILQYSPYRPCGAAIASPDQDEHLSVCQVLGASCLPPWASKNIYPPVPLTRDAPTYIPSRLIYMSTCCLRLPPEKIFMPQIQMNNTGDDQDPHPCPLPAPNCVADI